uniref:Selenoprotein P N-terminal domain-containing protein n=1 Tax=Cynoglossus semilaevis TaxID=244447 RepID=A0A3P8WKV8_CYNSE
MVVNHQGVVAQRVHSMLEARLSENITLYKQDEQQTDVWQTLNGDKNDFLIYDRCGRLTHHISLPYYVISHGHVERAIKDTYCNHICGICTHEVHTTHKDTHMNPGPVSVSGHDHDHHHGRHHGHGGAHDFHPRGLGYGHHHHHGHHHGGDDGTGQHHNHGHGQRSHDFSRHDGHHSADPDLIQHVMQVQLMPQEEAQGAPVRS